MASKTRGTAFIYRHTHTFGVVLFATIPKPTLTMLNTDLTLFFVLADM